MDLKNLTEIAQNEVILSIVKPEKPWSAISFIDKNSVDDILDYVNIEGLNNKSYGE